MSHNPCVGVDLERALQKQCRRPLGRKHEETFRPRPMDRVARCDGLSNLSATGRKHRSFENHENVVQCGFWFSECRPVERFRRLQMNGLNSKWPRPLQDLHGVDPLSGH